MSGIVGVVRRDGSAVQQRTVRRMVGALDHRGPDDRGAVVDGQVGLGHCQLVTTPEGRHDELPRSEGGLAITADARIDNRATLRSRLPDLPEPVTDTDLILAAYREWGTDSPEHLVGAYAFAIWDREQGRLFCARDHAGIRPFYWYRSGELFAFASEIKGLLALEAVPRRVDERRLCEYLASVFPDTERTFYEEITRLSPAHTLVLDDSLDTDRYWSLDPTRRLKYDSESEYAEAFRAVFETAVRSRLRADRPVGAYLSGGIDSSSVVCLAREHYSGPLSTYTFTFDGDEAADERRYAEAVIEGGGVDPAFIDGTDTSPLVDIDAVLRAQDRPFHGVNYFLDRKLFERVSREEPRVLLTGRGGDTTLSHAARYPADLLAAGRLPTLLAELRGQVSDGRPLRDALWHELAIPLTPAPLKRLKHRLATDRPPSWSHAILSEEAASRVGLDDGDGWELPVGGHESATRRAHHRQMRDPMGVANLETLDHQTASHGLVLRHPFLDRRLMEFCLALPLDLRAEAGLTRIVARRGLTDLLPDAVRTRRGKADFSSNSARALRRYERDRVEGLPEELGPLDPYVDTGRLRAATRALLAGEDGRTDAVDGTPAVMVWKALVARRWLAGEQSGPSPPRKPTTTPTQ